MARKRTNHPALATATSATEAPPSPSTTATGAMDSLLEKLRAAAPQARDQRDRRRRARLKDRHQVRIASGQKIPDMADLAPGDADAADSGSLSPTGDSIPTILEHDDPDADDVADRAANMLLGLRGEGDGDADADDGAARDGGLRVRRRRESSHDERRDRRRRRTAAGSGSGSGGGAGESELRSSSSATDAGTIVEESAPADTPTTVVLPPSPYGTAAKPVEILD